MNTVSSRVPSPIGQIDVAMRDTNLNVMHIISDLDIAGAQEVVRTLAEYLWASGRCRPVVCTFRDGPLRPLIEQTGIAVEVLPQRRYSIVAFPLFVVDMIRIWRLLAGLIKKYEIDVVQTHLLGALDFLVLMLRYGTVLRAVLWTVHNVDFLPAIPHWLLKPKRLVYQILYRLTARLVDGFIAVSDEVRESMIRQIGPIRSSIITINNGVDLRRYGCPVNKADVCQSLGIEVNSCLVVTIGRLTKQKGYPYLIAAALKVTSRYPNTHFLLIGDGELKEALQQQVQD